MFSFYKLMCFNAQLRGEIKKNPETNYCNGVFKLYP